ncbi:MAG: PorV/PorQ family protein [Candidatus Zixiibacteriota bacterium]
MKRKAVAIFLSFFFVWGAFVFKAKVLAETDNSGLSFLKFGMGAKAVGMGEAFVAQSGEVTSAWWNPAGLAGIEGVEASFTHNQWFQDITTEYFASAINFKCQTNVLGLSVALNKIPSIQKRGEVPSSEPIALFDAHDVVFGLSYATGIIEKVNLGITAKWLYEKIDIHSASGWGLDLGGIYSPLENLQFGLSVLNLGQKMKFEKEKFSLPTLYKVGVVYFLEKKNLNSDFVFGLDLVKPRDDEVKIHLGGEVSLYQTLKTRLGYQGGYDEKDFSFGLGTSFGKYSIDYGYLPHKSSLGNVHSVSLNIEIK